MSTPDECQFTLSVYSLQQVTGFSRASLWRRLQNAPHMYRKSTLSERSAHGRAHKFYRLSDVLIALRWAAKSKVKLADTEQHLIKIDAQMREQGKL